MGSWMPFIPEKASTVAGNVDALYFFLVGVSVAFALLIAGLEVYFAIRYRRRSPGEMPGPVASSMKLEMLWIVISFLISMVMFAWGSSLYFTIYRPPREALDIYVVGKQWMWKLQHLDGQREINTLHVPVGRKIKLIMTSEDVIHSFFVPAFRIKADVLPGRYTIIWFEAVKPGRYHLFCAEYCGTSHSGMGGWVVVMEPADYQAWLGGGAAEVPLASSGEKLFQDLACVSCHRSDTPGRGPNLVGLYNRTLLLENGQRVIADEGYIRESILNPRAKVVAGYPPIMPTFQGQVSEEQLLLLITYIKSIGPKETAGVPSAAGPGPSPQTGRTPPRP